MKIGILTFHNAYNYGAILQAYATQELVKGLGHDIEIIDYHNNLIDSTYNSQKFRFLSFVKNIYRLPLYLLEKIFYRKRREAYRRFISKYIKLSPFRYVQGKTSRIEGYDVILIGSDQLWNIGITGGFDSFYWGDFECEQQTRKIAWSICMNIDQCTSNEKDYIVSRLNNFSAISVREKSLQQFLKKLTTIEYPQTLDPTLLLNKQQWEVLCQPVKEKNYIVVYAVQDEDETIDFARQIAKSMQKKIVIVRSYSKHYWSEENKEHCGPDEFISYIRYADFIVTTSFHGTVFSLIFHKQFICPVFRCNTRIRSLLEIAGLGGRMIHRSDEFFNLHNIDYAKVDKLIESERNAAEKFLTKALNNL